jgi:hypothetical protein
MKKTIENIIFFFIDLLSIRNPEHKEEKIVKKETLDEINKKYIESRGL